MESTASSRGEVASVRWDNPATVPSRTDSADHVITAGGFRMHSGGHSPLAEQLRDDRASASWTATTVCRERLHFYIGRDWPRLIARFGGWELCGLPHDSMVARCFTPGQAKWNDDGAERDQE
jgi:hypothetical protein